jgi:NAD(P)-dependent dehydrogenase (short-subunit alcohol dehydrogenase family)
VNPQSENPARRAEGKVTLVTGAASGIGQATALVLARHGALLICADVDGAGAAATAGRIRQAGGVAAETQLDVTQESDWERAMFFCRERHARLDVLVNCAGISAAAPVTEMTIEEWRRVMAVNLDGVFLGTKHAVRAMRAAGHGGSIINVSSASGIKPAAGASAYSASKAAVCMVTKVVAKECIERGDAIRINSVCPSGVKTPLWRGMPFFKELVAKLGSEEAAYQSMAQTLLHKRFAEPEEIAEGILYLASDESRFVTGLDLVIDGGYTL